MPTICSWGTRFTKGPVLVCVTKINNFFKELFRKDFDNKYSRQCEECEICFTTCRQKKYHWFLLHYKQSGRSSYKPLNISKRSSLITIHPINYFLKWVFSEEKGKDSSFYGAYQLSACRYPGHWAWEQENLDHRYIFVFILILTSRKKF